MKLIDASMQDIIDDAEFDAETDRLLERPLWFAGAIFAAAVIATNILQGPLWFVALLSMILGFVLGEIVVCRRRRRRALARAERFKKHLGMPIAESSR